jgi:DNA-nicking Smr family endonuclease
MKDSKSKQHHIPDHALWDEVRRTIAPLASAPRPLSPVDRVKSTPAQPQVPKMTSMPAHAKSPPLQAFDRRTAQKLSRGLEEPEASLDLHGTGVEVARIH